MLKISNLQKIYRDHTQTQIEAFRNFNLQVSEGEFITIFGPNGCGKTTLLNLIAGAIKADSGSITFNNKPTYNLKVGYVFQDYRNSLFPWLNIKKNISFPLKLRGLNKEKREEKVKLLCKNYDCNINLELFPYQLSGGQQQFISLLRGLIIEPEIYLLDEPFSSLDYQTTLSMLEKFSEIWRKTKITTLFVSHEIDEAIFLAQKIVLLGNKPTKVIKIFENLMAYPRKIDLLGSLEFAKLKKEILGIYSQRISSIDVGSNIDSN